MDENNNKAVITCGVLNCSSDGSGGRDGGGGDDGGGGEDGGVPGGGCGSGGCSAEFDIGLYFAEKEKHGVPINKALTKESSYDIIVKNNSSLNYEKKFIVEVKKLECNNKETKLGEIEMTKVEGKTGGNVLYVLELKTEGKEAVYSCDPKNPWVLVAEAKIEDANKDNNKAILSCGDLKNCSGQPTGCDDEVCFACLSVEGMTFSVCKEVKKGEAAYNEAKERHKTKALCDAKCSPPINVALGSNCHIVDGKGQCLIKVGGVKSYPTDTDCLKECGLIALQGAYRYKCVSGKCVATGETGIGTYATESICKNSCFSFFPSPSIPPVVASRYKCVSGKCVVTTETGTGTYATESICKNNCYTYMAPLPSTPIFPPDTFVKRYKCSNNKCVVTSETGANTYSTEDACKKVCGYSFTNPAPPSF